MVLRRGRFVPSFFGDSVMIKSHRGGMHKGHSASKFRHDSGRTHPKNMKMRPMRGGFRL